MKYQEARLIATRVMKQLQPFCKMIDIVGSVRREKAEPHDFEITAIPRTTRINDLFGTMLEEKRITEFVNTVKSLGVVLKGDILTGRYVQIAMPENITLDLFIPQESDYQRIKIIRTGSAGYVSSVITIAWLKSGWCGTSDGLRLLSECYKKDIGGGKHKWICNAKNPTLPPIFETELDYYNYFDLPWLAPEKR